MQEEHVRREMEKAQIEKEGVQLKEVETQRGESTHRKKDSEKESPVRDLKPSASSTSTPDPSDLLKSRSRGSVPRRVPGFSFSPEEGEPPVWRALEVRGPRALLPAVSVGCWRGAFFDPGGTGVREEEVEWSVWNQQCQMEASAEPSDVSRQLSVLGREKKRDRHRCARERGTSALKPPARGLDSTFDPGGTTEGNP